MSFNFFNDDGGNEGDDTDDDLDLDAYDDTGLLALASRRQVGKKSSSASPASASSSPFAAAAASGYDDADASAGVGGTDGDAQSNEEDWEDIDWEDADQDEHDEEDTPPFPTRGVMINIGKRVGKSNHPEEEDALHTKRKKDDEEDHPNPSSSKKRKRNTVRVLKNVPQSTQQMVLNIRRTQLLCNVVRAVQCSLDACGGSSIRGDLDSDDDRTLLAHVAYSLIPPEFSQSTTHSKCPRKTNYVIPTKEELHTFSQWCFQFLNRCGERRRATLQRNVAHGAAAASSSTTSRRRIRNLPSDNRIKQSTENQKKGAAKEISNSETLSSPNQVNASCQRPNLRSDLLRKVMYLSPHYDEDPQLLIEQQEGGVVDAIDAVKRITDHDKALIFLTMARLIGWRARYVTSFNPMPLELTVDHPLLNASSNLFKSSPLKSSSSLHPDVIKLFRFMHEQGNWMGNEIIDNNLGRQRKRLKSKMVADANEVRTIGTLNDSAPNPDDCSSNSLSWVEILCQSESGARKPNAKCNTSSAMWVPILPAHESFDRPEDVESILAWMEVQGEKSKDQHFMDGTPLRKDRKGSKSKSPTRQKQWHPSKTSPVSYVLAVEHVSLSLKSSSNLSSDSDNLTQQLKGVRLTDVTPRYANTWSRTLRLRGASGKEIAAGGGMCVDQWWSESLKRMNVHCESKSKPRKITIPPCSVTTSKSTTGKVSDVIELESSDESHADEHEQAEAKALAVDIKTQKIPTSKAQFKQSPFFVIPSVLNSTEVLHPNARERICGVFKGELVYRRSDASKALRATKWLYQGRKVKEVELSNPAKQIKAKKTTVVKGFTALSSYGTSERAQEINLQSMNFESEGDSDLVNLYSVWQTDPWFPPYVGPNDEIPTNAYKNVELALINPGLTHLDQPRLTPIARKLGIPYSPCMLGFEGHGGNRTPTIRGIVVHEHNAALIREASFEWESHTAEKEILERQNEIVKRWKRLVAGMLMKERLDRDYG